ncbi:hypothetical protein HYV79_00690 [Candidatus Woesearchaeota archaeon]|nr:hypothetical protein [Candidatus Woesearchaeota archaeon]
MKIKTYILIAQKKYVKYNRLNKDLTQENKTEHNNPETKITSLYKPKSLSEEAWKYDISDTLKKTIEEQLYGLPTKEQELPLIYWPEEKMPPIMYPIPRAFQESELESKINTDYKTQTSSEFIQHAREYLSSSYAKSFNKYLQNNQKRCITPLKGISTASLGPNSYAAIASTGYDAILIGNADKDFEKGVVQFAINYKVSKEAAKLYLFLHEHAHLSQGHLQNYSHTVAERDVEQIVGAYAKQQAHTYQGREEEKLYTEIEHIANQRYFEVEKNYGKQAA